MIILTMCMHGWDNYNDINNVSEVRDGKHTTGGHNVLNKITLMSVC